MWQHFTSKSRILIAYSLSSLTRRLKSTKSLINLSINEKTNIATLELNSPPVNSLNVALFKEACDALDNLAEYRPNGLILTSTSNTVFSAGLEFKELYRSTPERVSIFWTAFQDLWLKLYGSSFPTAAAINGHAIAGGCVLALSCDYRVMLPQFTIGLIETKVGIVVPQWIQASMRNVLSTRETEKALTLGKTFNTDKALKIGLIDEIVKDKTDALERSEKFLLKFANIPYDIRAMMKKMLRGRDLTELENNREADQQNFLDNVFEPNFQKTLESYMDGMKKKKEIKRDG